MVVLLVRWMEYEGSEGGAQIRGMVRGWGWGEEKRGGGLSSLRCTLASNYKN
jgi:hypothetical protein